MNSTAQKPSVLVIFSRRGSETSTRFGGFAKRLQRYGAFEYADLQVAALEDLVFFVGGRQATVVDAHSGSNLADFDFVYFKGWESMPEIASCLANFLRTQGIPFIDEAVENSLNPHDKRVMTMKLWASGVSVVPTVFGARADEVIARLAKFKVKAPYIAKDSLGQKGQNNFLLKNKSDLSTILDKNADLDFIIQPFIPNDGDYRILVLGGKARFVMLRRSDGKTHLNNTSAGGSSKLISLDTMPSKIIKMAEASADAMKLQVTGVDVMIDKITGKPYILEVNPGSQIITGAFVEEKIAQFDKYFRNSAQRRYTRKRKLVTPKVIIGRHEVVGLPEFGIRYVTAKTDTGAYSSALHAENIMLKKVGDKETLHFSVPVYQGEDQSEKTMVECSARDFEIVEIKNSFGKWQNRYKIKTALRIRGKEYLTEVTLTNRESQKVPMLLGRRLLRSNFLVNVELSRKEK